YYWAGGQRLAVRVGNGLGTSGLTWLLSDHLGSPAVSVDAASGALTRSGYKPWGEERYGAPPGTFGFTGQRNEPGLGLVFFQSRWYDPALHRFVQLDTLIPEPANPADWDRYAYGLNNPVKYS